MNQNQVENVEQKLYQDRGTSFRGTARIRFAHLRFGNLCPRKPDKKITTHLKEKFSGEGCLRLEPKNHIPAVISQETLDASIGASQNVSQDLLLDNNGNQPPELRLPEHCMIECLQGLHRVAAAKELLPRRDWWWTIDLYLEGASKDLKTSLSEEYSNSINFSDGEIFLKLRRYNEDANKHIGTVFAEKRMWGRLSRDKRKDLRQLLKHEVILAALDALRTIPGLFVGFRIEHRFMAMKCHEEASNYLLHILQVWTNILGGKKSNMRRVDRQTVELLQLRAPGYSSHDASVVSKGFQKGTAFPAIRDQATREAIWRNLQATPCLIPSLYSFFEDIKYLQPPAKVLRQLAAPSKYSTREAMWRIFTAHGMHKNQVLVQTGEGEGDYRWVPGSSSDQFEFGYQQIWLYAWRHWTELVPDCPRKEEGEATPIPQRPDPRRWHGIGKLAARLGFESDEIDRLLSLEPDREIAREALLKARNPEHFGYENSAFENYVTEVCRIFSLAKELPADDSKACLLIPGSGESLARRCGRVFDNAYKTDRKHLFLPHLYELQHGDGSGVSSFAIRVFVYHAFFDRRRSVGNTPNGPLGGHKGMLSGQTDQNSTTQGQQETVSTLITTPGTSETQVIPPISEDVPNVPTSTAMPGTSEMQVMPPIDEHVPDVPASNKTAGTSKTQVVPPINEGAPNNPTSGEVHSLPTVDTDADMIDYIPTDPSKMIIKVWADGHMKDYGQPVSMVRDAVEKAMSGFESKGYKLLNVQGRAMRSKTVFHDTTTKRSNIVIITKENDVNRQMMSCLKQSLNLDKRIRQQKRKAPS